MPTRKNSKKRQVILEALAATTAHPTAQELYQQLKPDYPDLSLGTVYRNLSLFAEEGDAMSVGVFRGQERFEARTEPHAHLHCAQCGLVIDVPLPGEPETQLCASPRARRTRRCSGAASRSRGCARLVSKRTRNPLPNKTTNNRNQKTSGGI